MLDKKVIRKSLIIILIVLLILIGIKYIRRAFSRYESIAETSSSTDMALWIVNEGFTSEDLYIGEIRPIPGMTQTNFDAAIWNLLSGTLSLEDFLGESDNIGTVDDYVKKIEFSIQNYNEGENPLVSSVPLRYEVKLTATTFMPLEYRLYQYNEDGNTLKSLPCEVTERIVTDGGIQYKEITAKPNESNGNDFYLDTMTIGNNKEKDKFMLIAWMPDQENDDLETNTENYIFADLIEHLKIEIRAEQKLKEDEE